MKIITEYAAVVETLRERLESTGRLLHPESILPYPKETIRTAFVIVFEAMARDHLQSWNGVSKDIFLGVAMPLEHDFAPDEEVPEDPGQNFVAYSQRPGLEHAAAFSQRLRDIGALRQEVVRKSHP